MTASDESEVLLLLLLVVEEIKVALCMLSKKCHCCDVPVVSVVEMGNAGFGWVKWEGGEGRQRCCCAGAAGMMLRSCRVRGRGSAMPFRRKSCFMMFWNVPGCVCACACAAIEHNVSDFPFQ